MFTSKKNVAVGMFISCLLQSDPQYLPTVTPVACKRASGDPQTVKCAVSDMVLISAEL